MNTAIIGSANCLAPRHHDIKQMFGPNYESKYENGLSQNDLWQSGLYPNYCYDRFFSRVQTRLPCSFSKSRVMIFLLTEHVDGFELYSTESMLLSQGAKKLAVITFTNRLDQSRLLWTTVMLRSWHTPEYWNHTELICASFLINKSLLAFVLFNVVCTMNKNNVTATKYNWSSRHSIDS